MVFKFQGFTVDGATVAGNPATFVMDKDKNVVANYTPEVVYMSIKVSNPTTTPKTIDVRTTATYTIPANGSIDIAVKTGDEILLK